MDESDRDRQTAANRSDLSFHMKGGRLKMAVDGG